MTAFYAPDPVNSTQFVPGSNTPASGALLFCYQVGSSTKQNTYTDQTASTARTNPIVLDSGGNIPGNGEVWIASTAKFVLAPSNDTDPPLSPYWSRDNLPGVNDPSQLGGEWITSGLVPTFVNGSTFTFPGDQTPTFTSGRRLRTINTSGTLYNTVSSSAFSVSTTTLGIRSDTLGIDSGLSSVSYGLINPKNTSLPLIVSVLNFGAKGDGVTDDTAAFQAAINSVHANGGTLVIPSPGATYLLTSALDCTFATGANQRGFVIRGEGSTSLDATTFQITAKHTGHVFDCSGASQITFENISVGTDASTYPKTCFFLARNSSGGSIEGVRFNNTRVSGKFSNSIMYNYGSEDDVHVGNFWVNFASDAGTKVCRWTGNNISGLSSTFITIATGAQSTSDHSVFGGQYRNQSSDATADVFELEACDSLKVYGPWMFAATNAANGRALIFVNTINSASNYCVLHGIMGENSTFMQTYGVYFGDTAKTCTGWTISSNRFPNQTRAIFAHANVTIDDFLIDQITEQGSNGLSAVGTVQNSMIRSSAMTLIIGTSKNNTLDGFTENWTITTRNKDQWRDQGVTNKSWVPNTNALTILGGNFTKRAYFQFDGSNCDFHILLAATTSFTCSTGTQITGLPTTAFDSSAIVAVYNQNAKTTIGMGCVASNSIFLPAINVSTETVLVSGRYFAIA